MTSSTMAQRFVPGARSVTLTIIRLNPARGDFTVSGLELGARISAVNGSPPVATVKNERADSWPGTRWCSCASVVSLAAS